VEANAAGVGATGMLPAHPGMDALHEMVPWTADERGETLHEFQRRHHDRGGAVLVGALELQHDLAGAISFEPCVGNGGAGDIATQRHHRAERHGALRGGTVR